MEQGVSATLVPDKKISGGGEYDAENFFANIELRNVLAQRGAREQASQAYQEAEKYAPPTEKIGPILRTQIERLKREDPKAVPPVRDPYLE
jgi:hypothetical protein